MDQSRTADRGGPPAWGLGELTTSHRENVSFLQNIHRQQVTGTFECGNESSGSIKCGEFLD
jgi:hypothetical protein